ncbi:FAD-binding protein [Streptomyces sp. NPDC058701]|uniref:FAD-binding protein n=1 Tax=Streptomyces sp. NPDC058701 TaxID=3346608 RepID=UPI003660E4A9
MKDISRRGFLARTATTVIAFSTASGTWITEASAAAPASDWTLVPALDGELVFDAPSLQKDSTDNGNIVSVTPAAVLRPKNASDIQKMVRYCARLGIKVSARGEAHTTFGQGLCPGLVIEMRSLQKIREITATSAHVEAGVLWSELVTAGLLQGVTPPALTDYTELSVGGTLSVGGVSANIHHGAQVDNVLELTVVTGQGNLVVCSPASNRELFEACLGTLGQVALIVSARIAMVPAPDAVRQYTLLYADAKNFFTDLRTLLTRAEFTSVNGAFAVADNGVTYVVQASAAHAKGTTPNDAFLLRGLTQPAGSAITADSTYAAYTARVNDVVDKFPRAYKGYTKPWFDVFVPDAQAEAYVTSALSTLRPDDAGSTGGILLFAIRRSKLSRPFFRTPQDGEWVFLFDILTSSEEIVPAHWVAQKLDRNRTLYEQARALGSTLYPIGSTPMSQADWQQHYGAEWGAFQDRKQRFDPDHVLTPGPGIF